MRNFNVQVLLELVDKLSGPLKSGPLKQLTALQKQVEITDRSMGQLLTGGGVVGAGALLAAPLVAATAEAVRFESAMANVKKVVDFPTPRAFRDMNRDILKLSLVTPLAATELAEITAAAGQAGIARNELLRFTRDAAKMGVAFDISAGDAGSAMTGLRTIFKLTQNEVVGLGDAYNYLSNNMDARASDIVNIANRTGATGRLFGLSGQQVGALGASFLALKTPPEIASTSINALLNRLATAPQQTAAFQSGLAQIGLEATDLKRRIGVDAQGTLLDFLQRVRGSGDALGILTNLFGAEYADDIAKLVNSLDTYQGSLGLLGNQLGIAGSMQREYAARSATAANALIILRNNLKALGVAFGTFFLPVIQLASRTVGGFVGPILRLIDASPLLAGTLAFVVAGLAVLVTLVGVGIVTVAGFKLAMAQARIGLMLFAGSSEAAAGSQGLLNLALAGTRLRFTQAATGARTFFASMIGAAQLKLAALQAGGLSGALAVLRVGFMNAARASWAFTASLLTNPVFLLIAALVALGAGFVYAWRKSDDFRAGVLRSLQPIVTAWRGLMDQIAPLGELFGRVARVVGVNLDRIRNPLEGLGHVFFFTLGFILGATTIIFARITANVINGFTMMLKIARGNLDIIIGLFTLDLPRAQRGAARVFGAIRRSVDRDLGAAQGFASRSIGAIVGLFGGDVPKAQAVTGRVFTAIRTTVSTQLAGVENLVSGTLGFIIGLFRGDLETVRTSAAQIWQGVKQVFTPQIQLGGFVLNLYRRGLEAARGQAQTWNRNVRGWVGERFEMAGARTGALLGSLNRARRTVSAWNADARVWLGQQFTTAAANFAPLLRSVRSGSTDGRTMWRQFKTGVTQTFFLPWLKNEKLRSSLQTARETGTNIWNRVTGFLTSPFSLARAARANFDRSLTAAEKSGGRIWDRILGFFRPFDLPGVGATLFRQGLWSAEGTGKRVWGRVTDFLGTAISIPGLDWSAVQTTLTEMLGHITGFGPQLLEAGSNLIGQLISGIQSKLAELTAVFDNIKLPFSIPGIGRADEAPGGTGVKAATQANPTANLTGIANRTATPAAMRTPAATVLPGGAAGPQLLTPDFYRSLGTLDPASELGKMLAVGFAGGILNNQDVARYAARSMATGTIDEVRQKLQIRSPSRVFAGLGAFIPQGLGQGILGQRGAVTRAMQTLAAAAVAVPITPALGVAEVPNLAGPPPLTRPAVAAPGEAQTRTASGQTASGGAVHKTYSFAGANFNLDMSEIRGKEDFMGKLEELFQWFGDDE